MFALYSRPRLFAGLAILLAFGLGLGWGLTRDTPAAGEPVAGSYPAELKAAAADLTARLAPDGAGLSFEALHVQSLHQRAGGPLINVPVPSGTPQTSTEFFVLAFMTQGVAHGADYWMEARGGYEPNAAPVFKDGTPEFVWIQNAQGTWRNDGVGFYASSVSPGLGVDRFSLSRFPDLLLHLENVQDLGQDTVNGETTRHFSGVIDALDWPGIVVSDGLTFTSSPLVVEVWVSNDGQLRQIHGEAYNLNQVDYDLLIQATINFSNNVPASLPVPEPTRPPATPAPSEIISTLPPVPSVSPPSILPPVTGATPATSPSPSVTP